MNRKYITERIKELTYTGCDDMPVLEKVQDNTSLPINKKWKSKDDIKIYKRFSHYRWR